MRGHVPPGAEDQEICKRGCRISRWRSQDAENGGINMVYRDGTDVDKLCQVVLVWHIVAVPCNHVEWRMLLRAAKELATELVHNLPWLLLDLVLCNRMLEVAGVSETVGT
jgi:hypothetical protein